METATLVIANVDVTNACHYDPTCAMTRYSIVITIHPQWKHIFTVCIVMVLGHPCCFKNSLEHVMYMALKVNIAT
jgi:hypothetical protein